MQPGSPSSLPLACRTVGVVMCGCFGRALPFPAQRRSQGCSPPHLADSQVHFPGGEKHLSLRNLMLVTRFVFLSETEAGTDSTQAW